MKAALYEYLSAELAVLRCRFTLLRVLVRRERSRAWLGCLRLWAYVAKLVRR